MVLYSYCSLEWKEKLLQRLGMREERPAGYVFQPASLAVVLFVAFRYPQIYFSSSSSPFQAQMEMGRKRSVNLWWQPRDRRDWEDVVQFQILRLDGTNSLACNVSFPSKQHQLRSDHAMGRTPCHEMKVRVPLLLPLFLKLAIIFPCTRRRNIGGHKIHAQSDSRKPPAAMSMQSKSEMCM